MKKWNIKSYAKINLSLRVLGKFKNKYHKIESIISPINFYDEIIIKQIKKKNHEVLFYGRFSRGIPKINTVTKILKIMEDNKILKNKKYLIKIKKKIPHKSGMGGGSINAASILKFFIFKNKIKLSHSKILGICKKIGSDVILGLNRKISILKGDGKLILSNKKLKLYLLILKPNFGCSTELIYKNVKAYSKPKFTTISNKIISLSNISRLNNDLEDIAFKKFPILSKIKESLLEQPNIVFSRMTGSGSSIVGYFISKKASIYAAKKIKKKYKNCWCILSKTI